jgi:hypothetical protein
MADIVKREANVTRNRVKDLNIDDVVMAPAKQNDTGQRAGRLDAKGHQELTIERIYIRTAVGVQEEDVKVSSGKPIQMHTSRSVVEDLENGLVA